MCLRNKESKVGKVGKGVEEVEEAAVKKTVGPEAEADSKVILPRITLIISVRYVNHSVKFLCLTPNLLSTGAESFLGGFAFLFFLGRPTPA